MSEFKIEHVIYRCGTIPKKIGFPNLVGKRGKDFNFVMVNKLRVHFESEETSKTQCQWNG